MKIDNKLLEKAINYANLKHAGQIRKKTGVPYILHPLQVMFICNSYKKSINEHLISIACILHDVVEDCNVTINEIALEFGYKVASIVEELTSDNAKIATVGKTEYLKSKMLEMSSYSLRIKLADRLHNIKSDCDKEYIVQTKNIINALQAERKLTNTHKKIIKDIKKFIKNYESKKSIKK